MMYRVKSLAFKANSPPPQFIRYICLITKYFGVFPYHFSSSQGILLCSTGKYLYSFVPLLITVINIVFLWLNRMDSYYGHYFTIILFSLNHISVFIYIYVSYTKEKVILNCFNEFFNTFCVNEFELRHSKKTLIVVFSLWIVLSIFQLADKSESEYLMIASFFIEKVIIVSFEIQLCTFLFYVKNTLKHLVNDATAEVEKREAKIDVRLNQHVEISCITDINNYGHKPTGNVFLINSLRKRHLVVINTMDHLNQIYDVPNTILTLRERCSFAIYLYFWLKRDRILDLILGSANFGRICIIFYCFQVIKNKETEFKSVVNELVANSDNGFEKNLMKNLNKQVHSLNIKFDACGLSSMDFNIVISILTTTAGYVLLLNQLNL